jgi:hypothetical protein
LFRGTGAYVTRSLGTMFRVYLLYRPLRFFLSIAALFGAVAMVLFVRFMVLFFSTAGPTGHVQSVVVAGVLAMISALFVALGVLADLTAMNRRLLEEILVNTRLQRLGPTDANGERDPA